MVAVRLYQEACASLRLPFVHEMRATTRQRYPASQPVVTRDTWLYIARGSVHPTGCRPRLRGPRPWRRPAAALRDRNIDTPCSTGGWRAPVREARWPQGAEAVRAAKGAGRRSVSRRPPGAADGCPMGIPESLVDQAGDAAAYPAQARQARTPCFPACVVSGSPGVERGAHVFPSTIVIGGGGALDVV